MKYYMNFKSILFILAASLLAISTAYAQKMPENLKTQLREKAAKLYPNDKHEAKMWFSNQFYAWQAMQSPNSAIPKEDQKIVMQTAEQKFPLDFLAQTNYVSEVSTSYEVLKPAMEILGENDFKKIKAKALKANENDIKKASAEINKQAEAKREFNDLKFDDAAKLEQTKADLTKKFDCDFVSALAEARTVLNLKKASTSVSESGGSAPSVKNVRVESEYEKTNRFKKEAMQKFNLITCRNRNCVTGSYVQFMDNKTILLPITKPEDITDAEVMSNLGEKIEFNKNNIYINKDFPLILLLPKEYPKNSEELKFITTDKWPALIGKQLCIVGRMKESVKAYPMVANSLGEKIINIDSRLPFGIENGAMYINPEDGSIAGILTLQKPPYKMPEDFTKINEASKLIASIKTTKYNYVMLRLDTLTNWEKIDLKKFENQTKEFHRIQEVLDDYLDFFVASSLRNLMQKKHIGRAAKRAYDELNVKRLKKEEHVKRYKSYLNSIKTMLIMEIKKIKPEDFYSIYRIDVERYKEVLENMLTTLDNLTKGDFTIIMRQDTNQFRLH